MYIIFQLKQKQTLKCWKTKHFGRCPYLRLLRLQTLLSLVRDDQSSSPCPEWEILEGKCNLRIRGAENVFNGYWESGFWLTQRSWVGLGGFIVHERVECTRGHWEQIACVARVSPAKESSTHQTGHTSSKWSNNHYFQHTQQLRFSKCWVHSPRDELTFTLIITRLAHPLEVIHMSITGEHG